MLYLLLITYILGGLTLIPLLVAAAIAYAFYTSIPALPTRKPQPPPPSDDTAPPPPPSLKAWLTVRHTFEASPASYISLVRTLLDTRAARARRAEDAYYAVLKGAVLYLYEDEAMSECAAALDVRRCDVRIAPEGEAMLDGELFTKRNAVLLREKDGSSPATPKRDPVAIPGQEKDGNDDASTPPDPRAWYIFFRSAHDMEDWYFSLLHAPAPFPHAAQRALIDALDALPDRIPTRWLNALLGRLFLGVKGTRALESWVVGRLMKKLGKVKTPSWLTAVVVRSFDAGDVPPVLSKPMLKELTPEGDASVGVDISYIAPQDGGIRITVSATAAIALPATPSLSMLGFKNKDKDKDAKDKDTKDPERPYEVSLVLAVIVRRVEGNLLVKIKRAPSNRVWYAFTTMPRMDIEVTPVVSDRQIRWGMVLAGIEGKLREIIQDSVVLPFMDDIPFFDTAPLARRGGIFADAFPAPDPAPGTPPAQRVPGELPPDLRRARSAEALVDQGEADAVVLPDPDPEVQRAETIALGVRSASGSVRKRRTWFGGRQSEEGEDAGGDGDGDAQRLVRSESVGHRRAGSEDGAAVRLLVTHDDDDEGRTPTHAQNDTPGADLPTLPPRRHAARSVSAPRSTSPPTTPPPSSSTLSTSAPSPSLPSPTSLSTPTTPTPTASFLAALKSRGAGMAEKQPALKEAMRKWGGTWAAALRKERGASEGEGARERDEGDAWTGEGGRERDRGSYAELRRKVEQREKARGREGSEPIDIPGASGLERAPSHRSVSSSHRSGSDASSAVRVSPPNTGTGSASFLAPSAPRTTTELHTALRPASPTPLPSHHSPSASSSTSPALTISSPAPAPAPATSTPAPAPTPPRTTPAPTPIRAQPPKAATMTIPAIHARHRGDVMGFGSPVAPPTPAQEGGKGMGSVYKLLRREEGPPRNATAASASAPPPLSESPASQALKSLAEQDASRRVSSSSSSSSSSSLEGAGEGPGPGEAGWKPPLPPRPVRNGGG